MGEPGTITVKLDDETWTFKLSGPVADEEQFAREIMDWIEQVFPHLNDAERADLIVRMGAACDQQDPTSRLPKNVVVTLPGPAKESPDGR